MMTYIYANFSVCGFDPTRVCYYSGNAVSCLLHPTVNLVLCTLCILYPVSFVSYTYQYPVNPVSCNLYETCAIKTAAVHQRCPSTVHDIYRVSMKREACP